jgi:nucleoside-diphosphate-sugar epimerase
MTHHLVLGSGPVGSGTALQLAALGHTVTVATRSGTGPTHQAIQRAKVDASDVEALTQLAQGSATIVNAINPPYHRWPTDWPPIHKAIMTAAERTGATVVMIDNLYAYEADPARGPIHEQSPIKPHGRKGETRAMMKSDLLAAHANDRLQAVIGHASDFFGPTVTDAALGERAIKPILAGKTVRVLGDPDALHTWTYMPDVTETLCRLATDPTTWGRAWHIPSAPPVSARQLVNELANAAGTNPKTAAIPNWAIKTAGLVVPLMRELGETSYQFEYPFVMDDTAARTQLGLTHTPLDIAARATIAAARDAIAA